MSEWVKPFAWSYSALSGFETCPKRYWNVNVAKKFSDEGGAAGTSARDYGSDAHKALELRVKNNTPLPMGLKQYEPLIAGLIAAPGRTYAEQKLAMTKDHRPVAYFDKGVWVRAQADMAKDRGDVVTVIDWKFGKYTEEWRTQGLIMASLALAANPEADTVRAAFVWFKEGAGVSSLTYERETIAGPWSELLPRVERMEKAHATTDYPARPNGLCRRHCPVTSCPHHGG